MSHGLCSIDQQNKRVSITSALLSQVLISNLLQSCKSRSSDFEEEKSHLWATEHSFPVATQIISLQLTASVPLLHYFI